MEVKQKREDSSRKIERKLKSQEEEIKDLKKRLTEALNANTNRGDSSNTNRGEITNRSDSSNIGAEAMDNSNRGEETNKGPSKNCIVITKQQKAWMDYMNKSGNKDITIQFKKVYDGIKHPFANRFPTHILQHWHAKPTMLNLVFTHSGEWVKVPRNPDTDGGPNYYNFLIGRREKYIDENGIIRSAVAYGDEDIKLTIWFDMEEMTRCLIKWILPEIPFWRNNRVETHFEKPNPNQEEILWKGKQLQ